MKTIMTESQEELMTILAFAHHNLEALAFNNPLFSEAAAISLDNLIDLIAPGSDFNITLAEVGDVLNDINDLIDSGEFDEWDPTQIELLYDVMYSVGVYQSVEEDETIEGETTLNIRIGDFTMTTKIFLPDPIVNGWISDDNSIDIDHVANQAIDYSTRGLCKYVIEQVFISKGMLHTNGTLRLKA